ncbi:MAG: DUF1972 domain-containing protein [Candidatus Aenigmatarchaeota archaeon]
MKVKITLIGSRGIPAKYGGNETFVEELSTRLYKLGFQVYVTCESNRFYVDKYNNIIRIHTPSIESKVSTVPVINDIISTLYLLAKEGLSINIFYYIAPDGSIAAIFPKLLNKIVLINTDGLEWKRPIRRAIFWPIHLKILSPLISLILWFLEFLSVKVSNIIIADSKEIKNYLEKRYKINKVVYIPYGYRKLRKSYSTKIEENILNLIGVKSEDFYLTIARIVAENNIHIEVKAFKKVKSTKKLLIVGNFDQKDSYTRYLINLKGDSKSIIFVNSIYDKEIVGVLRRNCFAYIHAYEVGGTNPSLLEQMQFGKPILAYDVPFNREVLQEGGIYFKDDNDLANKVEMLERGEYNLEFIKKIQIKRIKEQYNWDNITKQYQTLFNLLIG